MKNPNKPERKFKNCEARVTKIKLTGARIRCRAVVYLDKKMLFLSDLTDRCFPGIPFKKYLTEQPMKVNVKKELPGVRFLVSLKGFEQAYGEYIEATSNALKNVDKKSGRVIAEQFEMPFESCVISPEIEDAIPGLAPTKTPVPGSSGEVTIDVSKVRTFTEEQATVKILDPKDVKSAISGAVTNRVKLHFGDEFRDEDPVVVKYRKSVWVKLYDEFDRVYGTAVEAKYKKTLEALGLGKDTEGQRERYMDKLMKFDKKYNEKSLACLLEVTKTFFEIGKRK
jgi:hypothetical protein